MITLATFDYILSPDGRPIRIQTGGAHIADPLQRPQLGPVAERAVLRAAHADRLDARRLVRRLAADHYNGGEKIW